MNLDRNVHNDGFVFLFIVYIPPIAYILPYVPCVLQEKHICTRIYQIKYTLSA